MSTDDFEQGSRTNWEAAINEILPSGADKAEWHDPLAISQALQPVLGRNNNHAMLPTGGGQDIAAVGLSTTEPGCLELRVEGGSTYVAKPSKLTVQRVIGDAGNSFMLLELDALQPTSVYDDEDDEFGGSPRGRIVKRGQEELVELWPGEYVERDVWNRGFTDYGEDGREIPLPRDARLVVRWLGGKFMFVAKTSLWNKHSPTYDGRHSKMSADQIRDVLERSLSAAAAH